VAAQLGAFHEAPREDAQDRPAQLAYLPDVKRANEYVRRAERLNEGRLSQDLNVRTLPHRHGPWQASSAPARLRAAPRRCADRAGRQSSAPGPG
jgi:hypothetical protein